MIIKMTMIMIMILIIQSTPPKKDTFGTSAMCPS